MHFNSYQKFKQITECILGRVLGTQQLISHQFCANATEASGGSNLPSLTPIASPVLWQNDLCGFRLCLYDVGYFKSSEVSGGCSQCSCDSYGTIDRTSCDAVTGQCQCLQGDSGIGGLRCDTCIPGYWRAVIDFENPR